MTVFPAHIARVIATAIVPCLLLAVAWPALVVAGGPEAPALPERPEHPALGFAARDVKLATAQLAVTTAEQKSAQAALQQAKGKHVATVKLQAQAATSVTQIEARQKALPALVKQAQEAATRAAETLNAAQAAAKAEAETETSEEAKQATAEKLKTLQQQAAEAAAKAETLATEAAGIEKALQAARQEVTALDEMLKATEATAKAAGETAAAADKQLATAKQQLTMFQQRQVALTTQGVTPVPKSIRLLATFAGEYPRWSCRFDPAGRYVYAGAQERNIQQCDLISLRQQPLVGHRSWVRRMTFVPGTGALVSGDYTGRVIRWSPTTADPEALQTISAHRGFARAVAISPDGQWLVTGGNDLVVRVWETDSGRLVAELPGHKRHIYNIAFHPAGRSFVSGDLMGVIKQWSTGDWQHERDFTGGELLVGWEGKFQADCGGIRGIDFSPDGRTLAVAGVSEVSNPFAGIGKPTVVLFDWKTATRQRVLTPKSKITGHAWGVRWHPSGRFLVAACGLSQGTLIFWHPDAAEPFHEFKLPQVAYDVDLHPDGLRIAVAQFDKTIRVYDIGPAPAEQKTAAVSPPRK